MRPTVTRLSDMPGPKVYNLWWGDKGGPKQKGVITYTVSPFKQNPTVHMWRNYLFNGVRRISSQVPYWIVPVAIGYGTYSWAKSYDAWQNSKEGHIALHGKGDHH